MRFFFRDRVIDLAVDINRLCDGISILDDIVRKVSIALNISDDWYSDIGEPVPVSTLDTFDSFLTNGSIYSISIHDLSTSSIRVSCSFMVTSVCMAGYLSDF
jgi:hypothetical protein